MTDRLTACLLTGQEAHEDGTCKEHGGRHCVITVLLTTQVHDCVIPGYDCTHGHHDVRPVQWPSLDRPPQQPPEQPTQQPPRQLPQQRRRRTDPDDDVDQGRPQRS